MNNKVIYKTALAAALMMGMSGNAAAAECYFGSPGWCLESGFDDGTPLTGTQFSIDDQGWMELSVNGVSHVFLTDFVVAERALDPVTLVETGLSPLPLAMADYLFAINSIPPDFLPIIYPNYSATQASASQLTLAGLPVSTWGAADISFQITDTSAPGSTYGSATLIETFTLTNTSADTVHLSTFAFTDVDISGGPDAIGAVDDRGELVGFDEFGNPIAYRQWDDLNELIASVDVAPDFYEVGMGTNCAGDMCQRIYEGNNGFDVMLANSVDPSIGDLNMAAQYVRTLAAGESFSFTQTLELNPSPVPVPAAVWLFGSGLIGLIGVARRKQSAAA